MAIKKFTALSLGVATDDPTQPVMPTGTIRVRRLEDDALAGWWEGGDVLAMDYDLFDDADPQYLQRDGDIVTLLQFKMRVIADSPELETLYLERIKDGSDGTI